MYKHLKVNKAAGNGFNERDFLAFCRDAGIPDEYRRTEFPFKVEEGIVVRKGKLFSFGWYENTVGYVTSYISWSERAGGECWQLNRHHSKETGLPVGEFHWVKVR